MADDSAPPPKMEEIAGGEAGEGDWGYLGSDAMAGNYLPAFPFLGDDTLSTPVSASMLLSMDSAAFFDLNAGFPSSSTTAPVLPAFHDFGSSVPFGDPAQFLGAPTKLPPVAAAEVQKAAFLLKPAPPLPDLMGQKGGFSLTQTPALSDPVGSDDDEEEMDQSLDDASSKTNTASLENAVGAAPGGGDGTGGSGRGKNKGMPAKNLMAERRRRKKLNDRLFMLRAVVPKISKMDRASILGDAMDYMKELMQKINDLQIEIESASNSSLVGPTSASFHPSTPTLQAFPGHVKEEFCLASFPSPDGQQCTVEVKVTEGHGVNVHMFCDRKPGILLSTMRTLDNLGIDIEQGVISCFSGFAMDVFKAKQRGADGPGPVPEEIKAVLMHTAGLQNAML